MHKSPSIDLNEAFPLEQYCSGMEISGDFDFKDIPSDPQNLFQEFLEKKFFKAIENNLEKAEIKAEEMKHRLTNMKQTLSRENLEVKRKGFEQKIKAPPFLRTIDKMAFTLSLILSFITQAIILTNPLYLGHLFTLLAIPLLTYRYYNYRSLKFQYFLLDFCYFANIFTIFFHIFYPLLPLSSIPFIFGALFVISNGPLAIGIVMWRNSLVFHDLDKCTSVFIHIYPALVTYTYRWYLGNLVTRDTSGYMSSRDILFALLFYIAWQIFYLVQTEIIDRKRIESEDLMTSAKWMGKKRPHPIYNKICKTLGFAPSPTPTLVITQLFYTLFTFIPMYFIFSSWILHFGYLSTVIIVCIWNGSNFYFEIFTETYKNRLTRYMKDLKEEVKDLSQKVEKSEK